MQISFRIESISHPKEFPQEKWMINCYRCVFFIPIKYTLVCTWLYLATQHYDIGGAIILQCNYVMHFFSETNISGMVFEVTMPMEQKKHCSKWACSVLIQERSIINNFFTIEVH